MSNPLDDIRSAMKLLESFPTTRYVCTDFMPATSTDPEHAGELVMVKRVEGNVTTIYFHPDNYHQIHHAMLKKEIELSHQNQDPAGMYISACGRTPEADKMQSAYWLYTDRQEKEGNSVQAEN